MVFLQEGTGALEAILSLKPILGEVDHDVGISRLYKSSQGLGYHDEEPGKYHGSIDRQTMAELLILHDLVGPESNFMQEADQRND